MVGGGKSLSRVMKTSPHPRKQHRLFAPIPLRGLARYTTQGSPFQTAQQHEPDEEPQRPHPVYPVILSETPELLAMSIVSEGLFLLTVSPAIC